MQLNPKDTIAAIASPQGLGGVGVIRISGPGALEVLQTIFTGCPEIRPAGTAAANDGTLQFNSHKLTHGYIIDRGQNQMLDEVMVVYMRAPSTYTGENSVEVYTHGGPAVMHAVLNLILHSGARLAEAGEFTKRAFLNGKLDLTAAEAVADVINAETEKAMLSAGRNLRGALAQQLHVVRETLLHVIMLFEACIDFPEDVEDDMVNLSELGPRLQHEVVNPLADIHKNYTYGCYLKKGLKLAVAGRPNVGKSSLMNTLLRHERVLVSEEAGTTRDVVTERWNIGGFTVELADTAGIHETSYNVEKLGIEKSFEAINTCDYILFVFEAHKGLLPEDTAILEQISTNKIIGVANKTDLGRNYTTAESENYFSAIVPVSVKAQEGLQSLEKTLIEAATQTSGDFDNMIIPNLRQTQLLEQILTCLAQFETEAAKNMPLEYLCVHLTEALKLVNTILGLKVDTDILDSIFTNFCIGK